MKVVISIINFTKYRKEKLLFSQRDASNHNNNNHNCCTAIGNLLVYCRIVRYAAVEGKKSTISNCRSKRKIWWLLIFDDAISDFFIPFSLHGDGKHFCQFNSNTRRID